MTNPSTYSDLVDPNDQEPTQQIIGLMAAMHAETSRHTLPVRTDRAIVDLQRAEPPNRRHAQASQQRSWAWPAVVVAAVVLLGSVVVYHILPSSPVPVSAAQVLQRASAFKVTPGHFATLTYRESYTYASTRRGLATVCGRHPGQPVRQRYQLWMRGAIHAVPQTIVEKSGLSCFAPCPSVVVGRQVYHYLYACGSDGPGPSPYDAYMDSPAWVSEDLASNILYDTSAAHRLQSALRGTGAISAKTGTLGGHEVYSLDFKSWPGSTPGDAIVLYFDASTYVLRGIDYRHRRARFPEATTARIRLAHANYNAPASSWMAATSGLPRYEPSLPPRPDAGGASLVLIVPDPSMYDLSGVCPGIHHLRPLLHSGSGPLRACRTVTPGMTANRLAWLLLKPNMRKLWTAQRAGIFPTPQVKASIAHAHQFLTSWVTYRKSLKYS